MAGIYIHIPFCKQACSYCNFYFVTSLRRKEELLEALIKEIAQTKNYARNETINTIYIGGGTPSLLDASDIGTLIEAVSRNHQTELSEITLECNPDDLTATKLTELKSLQSIGLNRLSIGVQSFFDNDLRYMNRAHNSLEAISSIKNAQDHGFDTLTIDLIYGSPELTNENWIRNLEQASELKIEHLSCYALTIEPKTKLSKLIKEKKVKKPDSDKASEQFELLMQFAKEYSFNHYEISNFAKEGKIAVHNTNYWHSKKYIGIGPAAHSFDGISRKWNISNINTYINGVINNTTFSEIEILNSNDKDNEYIMTSLRTMWGCDLDKLSEKGRENAISCLKSIDIAWYSKVNNTLILTDSGKHFADYIASELFIL